MTDINATVERIKSANAVPSTDSFPSGAWSSTQLLVRIDERNETMTDTLTPVRQLDPSKPPRRGRGPIIGLAVAAAVILILGVVGFNVLNNDAPPVATTVPPTSTTATPTTTTVAPTTTLGATVLPAPPVPADTPPIEVLAGLQFVWDRGNVDAAHALIWPDSEYFNQPDWVEGISEEIWQRYATNMTVERECALGNPTELADRPLSVPQGIMVTCQERLISGLQPGVIAGGGKFAAEIADGWIIDFFIFDYQGAVFETGAINDYRNWMRNQLIDPDAFSSLFDATTLEMKVDTAAARERHRELIPVFVADTAPRGELAMPADTQLIDLVSEFLRRFEAADLQGYAALLHPANNYDPSGDAEAAWFANVTGVVTERVCETASPTQVRCQETAVSGLAPGTILGEYITVWNGDRGWLWNIEFEGETADFNTASSAGVPEYRAWVETNRPDVFGDLFITGIVMRLDTEEVRALHKETIADYLAATG